MHPDAAVQPPSAFHRPLDKAREARVPTACPEGGSWSAVDLSGVVGGLLDGTLIRPRPTVGRLSDGSYWLYAGATNGVAGESGAGKTWTALATAAAELQDGHCVVYIDLEDSPITAVSRLLDLGVDRQVIEDRFVYVRPEVAFRDDARAEFWKLLSVMQPSLVVLDSTGESMALEGTDPNSDDGVAQWFQRVATAIARKGPAVLLLDHLPKSDSAASSPIGSQRKRAAISGVQMIQSVGAQMAFAKGRAGQAKLTCTKDRHGHFVTGDVALSFTLNPDRARGGTSVQAALSREVEGGAPFAHTRIMLRISDFLESSGGPQSFRAIDQGTVGKQTTKQAALRVLVENGYVTVSNGPRNALLHELVKPYQLGDPIAVPSDLVDGTGPDTQGCVHPWHGGTCNTGWCHPGHHGKCNEQVDEGYELDREGELVAEPEPLEAARQARIDEIVNRAVEAEE